MSDISESKKERVQEWSRWKCLQDRPFLAFGFIAAFLSYLGAFGVESWLIFCIVCIVFFMFLVVRPHRTS